MIYDLYLWVSPQIQETQLLFPPHVTTVRSTVPYIQFSVRELKTQM